MPPACAAVSIAAPRRAVWAALLRPETIVAIMPVSEVVSGWQLGQPFVWTFRFGARRSRLEGVVHRLEDERLLEYEYEDPHARDFLRVVSVQKVTIELYDEAGGTRVSVAQTGSMTPPAHAHAEGGWRLALNNLKHLVEREPDAGITP